MLVITAAEDNQVAEQRTWLKALAL